MLKKKVSGFTIAMTLFLLFIFISLVLGSAALFSDYPDYTCYSTGDLGYKAAATLLSDVGFNVSDYARDANKAPDDVTMIIVQPFDDAGDITFTNMFDENTGNEDVLRKDAARLSAWVRRGNNIILIGEERPQTVFSLNNDFIPYTMKEESIGDDQYTHYSMGKGSIYYVPGYSRFSNRGMDENNSNAVFLVRLVEAAGKKTIMFNEYYHGFGSDAYSLWDIIGPVGTLLVLQSVLGMLTLMLYLGRRFGKARRIREEWIRPENENLTALAAIYSRSKASNTVMERNLKRFIWEVAGKEMGISKPQGRYNYDEVVKIIRKDARLVKAEVPQLIEGCIAYINTGQHDKQRLLDYISRMDKIRREIKNNGI